MKGSSPYKTVGLGLPLRMTSALSNLLVEPRNYEAPPTDPKSLGIKQVWKQVMTGRVRDACLGCGVGTGSSSHDWAHAHAYKHMQTCVSQVCTMEVYSIYRKGACQPSRWRMVPLTVGKGK